MPITDYDAPDGSRLAASVGTVITLQVATGLNQWTNAVWAFAPNDPLTDEAFQAFVDDLEGCESIRFVSVVQGSVSERTITPTPAEG